MWDLLFGAKTKMMVAIGVKSKQRGIKPAQHQLVHISAVMQLCCKKITNYIPKRELGKMPSWQKEGQEGQRWEHKKVPVATSIVTDHAIIGVETDFSFNPIYAFISFLLTLFMHSSLFS